uniref:Putative secreted protein n=1 Tax=Ixodes ricinus TaxID=34613 RepID=A0A090XEQ6_IXORI
MLGLAGCLRPRLFQTCFGTWPVATCQSSPSSCNCCSWGPHPRLALEHIGVGHARVGLVQRLFINDADGSLQQSLRVDLQALRLLHRWLELSRGQLARTDPHAPVQLLSFGDFRWSLYPGTLVPGFPSILGYWHPCVLVQETRRSESPFRAFSSPRPGSLWRQPIPPRRFSEVGWATRSGTWSDMNNHYVWALVSTSTVLFRVCSPVCVARRAAHLVKIFLQIPGTLHFGKLVLALPCP